MTDDELNALFAEHVAGKFVAPNGCVYRSREAYEIAPLNGSSPIAPYTTDANAVLPWLEKMFLGVQWFPRAGLARFTTESERVIEITADTFPRAAVLAMLKAEGVAV